MAGNVISLLMMFASGPVKFVAIAALCVFFYVYCDPYERRKKK